MMLVNSALDKVLSVNRSEEDRNRILEGLKEPFPPELIKFRPQGQRKVKINNQWVTQKQALTWADPRAYTDRLNELVGTEGWFSLSESSFSPSFTRLVKTSVKVDDPANPGRYKYEKVDTEVPACKLIVTVTVGIMGLGLQTDVGEEWADEDNAHANAFAQALKRACMHFGLGRYFYSLGQLWLPVNDNGYFFEEPTVEALFAQGLWPEWALPARRCIDGCGEKIVETTDKQGKVWTPTDIVNVSRTRYQKDLCAGCFKKAVEQANAAARAKKAAESVGGMLTEASKLPPPTAAPKPRNGAVA